MSTQKKKKQPYFSRGAILLHQLYVGPVASQSLTLDLWRVPDPDESDIVATNQIGHSKAPPNYSSHVW